MKNLTKDQLIGIIESAQHELALITNVENSKIAPIRGKSVVGYYCPSETGRKKWKVEHKGKFLKWCETQEEVIDLIQFIQG
jgi:hypothetical protein